MVKRDPETETYTMLGYCYGSTLGKQLTQLLESEKITPTEGLEEEFHHILDKILSNIVKKFELLHLKNQLKSSVDAANAAKSAKNAAQNQENEQNSSEDNNKELPDDQ